MLPLSPERMGTNAAQRPDGTVPAVRRTAGPVPSETSRSHASEMKALYLSWMVFFSNSNHLINEEHQMKPIFSDPSQHYCQIRGPTMKTGGPTSRQMDAGVHDAVRSVLFFHLRQRESHSSCLRSTGTN